MKIGIDVDGILADFNTPAITRCIALTGEDRFQGKGPNDITVWNYPEDQFGYPKGTTKALMVDIAKDAAFWYNAPMYSDTRDVLYELARFERKGNEIYFITNRAGVRVKDQTERWLNFCGFGQYPTVIISQHKGLCARALDLDIYIDDKDENCMDVAVTNTKCYMLARGWNHTQPGVVRLKDMASFIAVVNGAIDASGS